MGDEHFTSRHHFDFLLGYQKKYRMWADGATEEETSDPSCGGNEKEYVDMLKIMLQLGVTGLNLDVRNLKAYPSTVKLWHQLQAYPHEIIPIMDQTIKDLMVDLAEREMHRLGTEQRQTQQSRTRVRQDSSMPSMPSSEANEHSNGQNYPEDVSDLVQQVETRVYKVKPFGLDNSINMRDLNPNGELVNRSTFFKHRLTEADMDKMVSIKGLAIRTTPVIPDMKTGQCVLHNR